MPTPLLGSTYKLAQTAYGLPQGEVFTKGPKGYQSTTNPEMTLLESFVENSLLFVSASVILQQVPKSVVIYNTGTQFTVVNPSYGLLAGAKVIKLASGVYAGLSSPTIFIGADIVETSPNFSVSVVA